MKTKKWYMLFVMIFIANFAMAQNEAFGDDIYFSSKNKKTEASKPKVVPVKKAVETPVVVEATVSSERNVDEYNRRYINDKEYIDEAVDEDNTVIEYVDGELTQKIVRFHDPSKVIISGADNVNIYYDGKDYQLDFDEPSSSGLSININSGYGYNPWYTGWYPYYGYGHYSPWHYGWHSSWYSGWYDSWYYGGYYGGWYSPAYYYGGWYSPWYYGGYYGGGYYGSGYYGGSPYHYYGASSSRGYHSPYANNRRYARDDNSTTRVSNSGGTRYSSASGNGSSRVSRGDIMSTRDRQNVRDQSTTRTTRSAVSREESGSSSSSSGSTPRTRVASTPSSSSSGSYSSGSSRSNNSGSYSAPPRSSDNSSSGSYNSSSSSRSSSSSSSSYSGGSSSGGSRSSGSSGGSSGGSHSSGGGRR